MKNNETEFEFLLKRQIRKYIHSAKQDGTVSMSLENLKQCVRPPSHTTPGAPQGINAQWAYAQVFQSVCQNTPAIASFLTQGGAL